MLNLNDKDNQKKEIKNNNAYLETIQQCHNFLFE